MKSKSARTSSPSASVSAVRAVDGAAAGGIFFDQTEAALAGIALSPDAERALDLIASEIPQADLRSVAGRVLGVAVALHKAGKPVNLVTVADTLPDDDLQAIGGRLQLSRLVDAAPPIAHAEFHVKQWRQGDTLRRLRFQLEEARLLADEGRPVDEVLRAARVAVEGAECRSESILTAVHASDWFDADPPPLSFIVDGTIEAGDKGSVIAKSKERKSFFAMQMALCVAAGMPFLCWRVPRPCCVLLVQFEIKAAHLMRRFRHMSAALGLDKKDIAGRLFVVNGRGWGRTGSAAVVEIGRVARKHGAELVIIDPLYKVCEGDENRAEDMKPTLAAFDRLAESGAAVVYVHHDPKGDAGARDIRDRGAGTGVTGRDDDFRFVMAPHDTEPAGAVLETMRRNFKPQEPVTIRWDDRGCFDYLPHVSAVKQVQRRGVAPDRPNLEILIPEAVAIVKAKPMDVSVFRGRLYRLAKTQARVRELFNILVTDGHLKEFHARGRGRHEAWIGTATQIASLQQRELHNV